MTRSYEKPGSLEEISVEELRQLSVEDQKEVALFWFRQHYEDPAEMTPYVSAEGGYLWIWGGPYDAREELYDEFEGAIQESVLEELADELSGESHQWAPGPKHPNLAKEYVDVLASSVPFGSFRKRMNALRDLAKIDYPEGLEQAQHQLILAAGISALEAYLAERAVRGVQQHEEVLRRFIEKHSKFREQKIPVSEVPKVAAALADYAKSHLSRVVWHRLDEARRIFERAFEVKFPETSDVEDLIRLRHDIVHRAGNREDGTPVDFTSEELLRQIEIIEGFVDALEPQLPIDDDTELTFL